MFTGTIVGNVGADPETRFTDNGKQITTVRVAVAQYKKDVPPIWVKVVAWGDGGTAKVIRDYVQKGSKLAVSGEISMETWTDKQNGSTRQQLVLTCHQVSLLGRKDDRSSTTEEPDLGDIPF